MRTQLLWQSADHIISFQYLCCIHMGIHTVTKVFRGTTLVTVSLGLTCYVADLRGTDKSILTAAHIQRARLVDCTSILTTLGGGIAVRHAASATVRRSITTVATSSAACAVAAWGVGVTRISIASEEVSRRLCL